eukprot:gnl/TRDRNA2_/TRDRNA2_122221_c2_seq1.p1 gnl/TRDRNA2_/TRDRNA2_122221_c2~~gnl/TRDRNA2_/TRDRNA2_122221_c2_seq1.p1  ORF type:complete len:155 (+),score=32.28 gnl/TRDRNA2_/TRDRNA2_122221_c2_seq1:2-466(+)
MELAREDSYMNAIKEVFQSTDTEGTGTLTVEQLEEHLKDENIMAWLHALEIDVSEVRGFYALIDIEGKGQIGIEEFCVGCMRIKGGAKGIDVASLLYENKKLVQRITQFHKFSASRFETLGTQLTDLRELLARQQKRPDTYRYHGAAAANVQAI